MTIIRLPQPRINGIRFKDMTNMQLNMVAGAMHEQVLAAVAKDCELHPRFTWWLQKGDEEMKRRARVSNLQPRAALPCNDVGGAFAHD